MLCALTQKLSPVWRMTLLVFLALRAADLVNAFIGIWLVPRYIPADQLGAVLPLTQAASFLALPLSILLIPYTKLLNLHSERGEHGQARALLRDAALLTGGAFLLILAVTPFLLERIFRAFQIENGRLAMAIVLSAVLGTLAPVFTETLRAEKRFALISLATIVAAPLRLLIMCITLPLRGLTGYFIGQASTPVFQSVVALADFVRRHRGIRPAPYWQADRRVFFAYALPLAAIGIANNVRGMAEMMLMALIPSAESAAYYQMTRFTELGTYIGATIAFVLFPYFTGDHARGRATAPLLRQSMLLTGLAGLGVALLLTPGGPLLFRSVGFLRDYTVSASAFGMLALIAALRAVVVCFTTHELACGRFRYIRYYAALCLVEAALAWLLARGPAALRLPALLGRPWSLADILVLMLGFAAATLVAVLLDLGARARAA